jgi:hypothetical protein
MQPVVQSAIITGGCAIVVAIIAGWFSHAAGRRAGKNEFIGAVQAAANEVITRLREEIDRLTKRCEAAEARCETAEDHHRACRTELDALWEEVKRKPVPPYIDPTPQPRKRRKPHARDT